MACKVAWRACGSLRMRKRWSLRSGSASTNPSSCNSFPGEYFMSSSLISPMGTYCLPYLKAGRAGGGEEVVAAKSATLGIQLQSWI